MPTLRGCKNPEWYQIEKGTLQIFEMPTTSFPPWRFGFWEHPKCKIIQKLNLLKHIMVLTIRMLIIKNLVSVRTLFCSFLEGYLTAIKIWQQCLLSLSLLGEHVFCPLRLKYVLNLWPIKIILLFGIINVEEILSIFKLCFHMFRDNVLVSFII